MTKMLQTATKTYLAQTRNLFYCNCKIKIPEIWGEAFLDEAFGLLEQLDKQYNAYHRGSSFSKINNDAGNWITVDTNTYKLIEQAQLISRLSDGAYDITALPLIQLWGFYKRNDSLLVPAHSAINKALETVNSSRILLRGGNEIKIEQDQQLITGSFIKAFAAQEVMSFLKAKGVTDAIINAGGSSILACNDETHPNWFINIPNALGEHDTTLKMPITNQCFSLSASEHNYIQIDGKKYSHIINARTGQPSENRQVIVLCDNAALGDMLSTALYATEPDALKEVLRNFESHFDFTYSIIDASGNKITNICS